jgi:hypothetical protein
MRVHSADISKETRDALKKELGDAARNKPPKGMSPDDFVDYLKERYKNSPDGVLFRERTRHRRASADGGINWISLGERAIVLHDARKFPDGLPEKGNVVRINYQSGIAEIVAIKTRNYERDGR